MQDERSAERQRIETVWRAERSIASGRDAKWHAPRKGEYRGVVLARGRAGLMLDSLSSAHGERGGVARPGARCDGSWENEGTGLQQPADKEGDASRQCWGGVCWRQCCGPPEGEVARGWEEMRYGGCRQSASTQLAACWVVAGGGAAGQQQRRVAGKNRRRVRVSCMCAVLLLGWAANVRSKC